MSGHLITKSRGKGCFQCHMPTPWLTRISSTRGLKIFTRSPPWCRGGLLDLWSKGQQFEPRRRQLEKVVNLDENSWTPTKIIKKRSFSEAQKHWRGWDDNACLGVRNTSSIGAWPNFLVWRPLWYFQKGFFKHFYKNSSRILTELLKDY